MSGQRGPKMPKCPVCGAEFHISNVDFASPFRCPVCGNWLRVPRYYPVIGIWTALFISAFLCFEFGARGVSLFWGTLLTWIPVFMMVIFWSRHFAPPKLTPCPSPSSCPLHLSSR